MKNLDELLKIPGEGGPEDDEARRVPWFDRYRWQELTGMRLIDDLISVHVVECVYDGANPFFLDWARKKHKATKRLVNLSRELITDNLRQFWLGGYAIQREPLSLVWTEFLPQERFAAIEPELQKMTFMTSEECWEL